VGWTPVAAFSASAVPSEPPANAPDLAEPQDRLPAAGPRPLVLLTAAGLLLIGLVSLVVSRIWRRRALRELNGD
jgi:LPXTG-motif cell wall-anchored protein